MKETPRRVEESVDQENIPVRTQLEISNHREEVKPMNMFGYFYLALFNSLEANKGKWKVVINHGWNLAMLIQGDKRKKRAKVMCKVAIIRCSTESN